ncbi:MAG TPA: nitroreductase family deazaflavin-dependent oxidoreductase [Acidimicrobiia bacterium]|nr:nitroreductase family deazaflavin-dependent oxidoreductase [Acidimicrobiia bacterium]
MKDSRVRRLSRWHRRIYRLTRGLIGRRLVDNDMLILTTTGRRSGRPHEVPLLYLRDGESLVVIASYGGRPNYPDWYLNLVAQPEARVQVKERRQTVTARVATSEERKEWWPRIVDAYEGYSQYQSRTDRNIPVVFLDPR